MYVKIMSEENLPDNDPSKGYNLIECGSASFHRDSKNVLQITIWNRNSMNPIYYPITTNVYLMNDEGKTIDSISPNKPIKNKSF